MTNVNGKKIYFEEKGTTFMSDFTAMSFVNKF